MIENFSEEGIQLIISELKDSGYIPKAQMGKISIWHEAEDAAGLTDEDIPSRSLRDNFYVIADTITGNTTDGVVKGRYVKDMRSIVIPSELETEYLQILTGLLLAVKPYLKKDDYIGE